MPLDIPAVRERLRTFNFVSLFTQELGWDFPVTPRVPLTVRIKEKSFELQILAQKRGVPVYQAQTTTGGEFPDYPTRRAIHKEVRKSAHEHLIVFVDAGRTTQIWQWVAYRPGQPPAYREHSYSPATQTGDALIQKLATIFVPISEEEAIDLTGAVQKLRDGFDREKVTKKFYDRFKTEHAAFLKFIKGIKAEGDLVWYTSLMLNRLMFVYFMQKKGFLDGDNDYLQNRMKKVREQQGKNKFLSFYRYFLTRLFHDGLGKHEKERILEPELEKLLGRVPYLNGGFFEVHQLEDRNPKIDIPDEAFERLFKFFNEFSWHLDDRPLSKGNEINPDVVGYIFEKYINQKQMGAYYTKEDITEYISKNTIIPFLFDAAKKRCAAAFKSGSSIWKLLSDNPDRYIYAAVRHGVIDDQGNVIPLPKEIAAGIKQVNKRDYWNRPATAPFALPTETWREHVSRRQRCLELREKLQKGEVAEINELITLNLDIWQFARDVFVNCESPELLRAFWHAIQTVTVLDPTCGSGAFLFAALNILETLYSDCLEAMGRFILTLPAKATSTSETTNDESVAEAVTAVAKGRGKPKTMERFSDFTAVLSQISAHCGQKYFILKSIIINNLYGVDIMEEAVEICKLRLFLKLVAQVEKAEQIEPLPDIDFNIRAGNTLVGYVSLDEVRSARATETAGSSKQKLLLDNDAEEEIRRIEEEALVVQRAFEQFRAQQTKHGGKVTAENKAELRRRLAHLDAEFDHYLASEYGVNCNGKNKSAFIKWKASHQPFHWFVEFFGIMQQGGFDVVIGNPPYVEYGEVKEDYTIRGYRTESCGNLYAFMWERCLAIVARCGRLGMIQPVAAVCTEGYEPLQAILRTSGSSIVSNFNDRPSKLFDGLEHIRLCIILHQLGVSRSTHSTCYNKWQAIERETLFNLLMFVDTSSLNMGGAMAKVGSPIESSILGKLRAVRGRMLEYEGQGEWSIFYTRKLSHFVQILDFVPSIKDGSGTKREPSELKILSFESAEHRDVFLAILNSSTFYWMITVYSDCRNLNRREIEHVRFDFASPESASEVVQLCDLSRQLMSDICRNSKTLTMRYKKYGELRIQCTYPKYSKLIIDRIDEVLGNHLRMTPSEIDFVINFDIKYRMGQDDSEVD